MRRLLAIVVAAAFVSADALARLGQTEAELEARYGKPTPSEPTTPGSDETLIYWKDHVRIAGEFVKGRCFRITYSGEGLTQEVIDTLLKSNGQGLSWSRPKGGGPNDYVRADKLATAKAEPASGATNSGSVVFTLVEWQKAHDKAIQDAKDAEKAAQQNRIKKLKEDL